MGRELEGKVAVVTGAASGIGLASTEAMLAAGSRVVMVDRDEAVLKALCTINQSISNFTPSSGISQRRLLEEGADLRRVPL